METRQEIIQILNRMPDEALGKVLDYLRQLEMAQPEPMRLSAHLGTILQEDRELLEKLAK